MAVTLVTTKLHTPPVRPELVSRPWLLARLDEGLHRKLTLVSAPAGFGKTTLLAEWTQRLEAARPPRARVAWISLDEGDNDPARFAAYLTAALRPDEGAAPAAPSVLDGSGASLHESHLGRLINFVAGLPQAVVLVLDDYHLITAQAIHSAVTLLIEHLPPNLHLVLATRADPPLPLPRLRARDHLAELRQEHLRFTAEEAAAFLNQVMGLGLAAADVAALEDRTEGWIAGLQMAALSLQGHGPWPAARSEFVRALTGSHRFILDYLVEEVLEQQPPAVQEFLLQTSILERLSGPLCDRVVGYQGPGTLIPGTRFPDSPLPDSRSTLEHLEAANLFIVPLDDERRWYRYHRLFSDLLRQRLQRWRADLVPVLHRRASAWHEEQGLIPAAIEHALAARDFERAAALVEANAEATLMRSEVATFVGWVGRLPDAHVRRLPNLSFFYAWALLMSGHPLELVEERLRDVVPEPPGTGVLAGRAAALRAYLAAFQADTQRAIELGRQALDNLPEDDRFLRSVVTWILSMARLAEVRPQEAQRALDDVVRRGQETGNALIAVAALSHQATLLRRQGHLHQAREVLERALQVATDPQGRRLPVASEALIGLGELEREWNNLAAAAGYLEEGIDMAGQWTELAAFDAYLPLARVRLALGDVEGAQAAVNVARRIARRSEMTVADDLVADMLQAHLFIIQGDLDRAADWAARRGLLPGSQPGAGGEESQDMIRARTRKYEQQVLARLFLGQGRHAEALDLLAGLLAQAWQLDRVDLIIQVQILTALACQAAGRGAEALAALAEALALAEPGDQRRVFLDEGQPMAGLLHQAAARGLAPAYVARLLADFPAPGGSGPERSRAQPLVESLSERELEVLRLLAAGLSNPEIAGELVVAVSTVQSHCKSIYGKLGVHRRWDAVQRARDLGLI